jgi:excisionase family DNA binding protein
METYFTIEGIAKYLNYAEKTIRKWVLNREIPYIKIHQTIRFRLSEIEVWVEQNRVCPQSNDNKTPTNGNESLFDDAVPPEELPEETDSGETAETE